MAFKLELREDRPATIGEHRALRLRVQRLQMALQAAREKLGLYRDQHSGDYVGGMEYAALMRLIDEALHT